MTELRGAHLTLPTKLALLAGFTQLVTIGALLLIIEVTAGSPTWVRVLGFAEALSPPIFMIIFIGRFLIGRLTIPVMDAYQRVAAGDFAAQLPPMTAGSDFVGLRQAFSSMAAALERSMQALREADLDRRRLFADLAHELATPTSTLLGIAHALRNGDGDTARLLDHLEHESARLDRLIADVREVAHLEDPTMSMLCEPCDVGDLAVRAAERARVAAAGSCELRCEVEAAPAHLDPLRIDQVLTNLLNNAVRHAPGGTVAVAVHADADAVTVKVEDSGEGVPDEVLPQLGRRLLRMDPSRSRATGGHGLGLAIVRAIVERHGGEVTFGRAELGGLAVLVRLPADQNQVRSLQQ